MSAVPSYFHYWAKTGAEGKWHGLPYHLLDVAATAELLLGAIPSPSLRPVESFLAHPSGKNLLAFLAASHDIGKANPMFQGKSKDQRPRLKAAGIRCCDREGEQEKHGGISTVYLAPFFQHRLRWPEHDATSVAMAIGGHHGKFPDRNHSHLEDSLFRTEANQLLDDLADLLQIEHLSLPDAINPFLAWLSGFVCVADWLGSMHTMTTLEHEPKPLDQYLTEARRRADLTFRHLWEPCPATTSPRELITLLPATAEPNHVQSICAEIAERARLTIVEAPTGEGKTEAAFALIEPHRATGAGVYFALPTMATANGLASRVNAYLGTDARLLHSSAWLQRDQPLEVVPNIEQRDKLDEDESPALDWFAASKRGLIFPYGVGTIDQMLLGVLYAKHMFVRLFGLAGKAVVIDEVHAYDIYMNQLINVLLSWLRVLDCRVVLLSATLSRAQRAELLEAWCPSLELPDVNYPAVTWVDAEGNVRSHPVAVAPRKPVTFTLVEVVDSADQGAQLAIESARETGGFVALLLNTVKGAQRAYQTIRELAPELDALLFHARFTAHDRDQIEKLALDKFGKHAPRKKPAIIVATQVIEQSLDLDFDTMITELAPIDLLIQRAGRVHRHCRDAQGHLMPGGSDERPNPRISVLVSRDDLGLASRSPVYSPATQMRTAILLDTGFTITSPENVARAIEAVYGALGEQDYDDVQRKAIEEAEKKDEARQAIDMHVANRNTIHKPDSDYTIVDCYTFLDENQVGQLGAVTRLQRFPTETIVICRTDESGKSRTWHGGLKADKRAVAEASLDAAIPNSCRQSLVDAQPKVWKNTKALSHRYPLTLEGFPAKLSIGKYTFEYSSEIGFVCSTDGKQLSD